MRKWIEVNLYENSHNDKKDGEKQKKNRLY